MHEGTRVELPKMSNELFFVLDVRGTSGQRDEQTTG